MKCLHVSTILTVCFVVCTGIFAQDNAKPESTEKNGVNTYAQLLKKQSEALEFAENAKNFSRRPVRDPKPLYIPTPKDKERGLVFYQPLMITPFRGEQPSPKDVKRTLSVEAAGGEYESVIMAALALKDCKQISFNVNTQPEALHGVTIEILPVVMGPVRRGKTTYDFQALWVPDIPAPVDMKKDDRKAWLVRVYVPKQTAEGEYSITLSYSSAHGKPQNGPALHLRVLPFDLVDPWKQGYMFGAFCSGADFNRAQYRQMKAHGIEGIQWFWGHYGMSPKRIINDNGTLRMDFTPMDRTISRFKAAGLRGPIVLAFGNYYASNFERVICRNFNRPTQPEGRRKKGRSNGLAKLNEPETDKLIVEALRQLFDHAKKEEWPEIVILPYDEPTMLLMKEHRHMVGLIRKNFPNVRLYGCSMNKLRNAKKVADCDIIASNGDFAAIRRMTRKKKITSWFYGGATVRHGFQRARWRYGMHRYRFQAEGSWFWSYNYYTGNPWNEFDGSRGDSAWVICWPPLEDRAPSVCTIAYEGLREGVDDVRYAMTLKSLIQKTSGENATAVKTEYRKWLSKTQNEKPEDSQIPDYRKKILEFILMCISGTDKEK